MSVDKITVLLYSSPLSQAVPLGLIIMFTEYLDSSPRDDGDDNGVIMAPIAQQRRDFIEQLQRRPDLLAQAVYALRLFGRASPEGCFSLVYVWDHYVV
jgi:hypothetical protein